MAKILSGGGRLKKSGRKLIWVTASDTEQARIRIAAAIQGIPMSQFLLELGLRESDKIIEKNGKKTLT